MVDILVLIWIPWALVGVFISTKHWNLEATNCRKLAIYAYFLLFVSSLLYFLVDVNVWWLDKSSGLNTTKDNSKLY